MGYLKKRAKNDEYDERDWLPGQYEEREFGQTKIPLEKIPGKESEEWAPESRYKYPTYHDVLKAGDAFDKFLMFLKNTGKINEDKYFELYNDLEHLRFFFISFDKDLKELDKHNK